MIGPISRIILRYLSAALVTYGLLSPDMGAQIAADPDLVALIGLIVGVAVEGGYTHWLSGAGGPHDPRCRGRRDHLRCRGLALLAGRQGGA